MERPKGRPLRTLRLGSRPLAPHALAWSCDAELAVGTEDAIYIFLPEYPKAGGQDGETAEWETAEHQFSLTFRVAGIIRPDPAINARLCAFAGVKVAKPADDAGFQGVGHGAVTAAGGAVSQPVRLEWSPNGLGCNLRPVLGVMLTNGSVVMLGEHIDAGSTTLSSMRARSFKCWKVLWGLGARLPIPDDNRPSGFRSMDERIVSFSWAREIATGRALLAYLNDAGEVTIMSVQFFYRNSEQTPSADKDPVWQVHEVARFDASGPHEEQNILDPDYTASGSPCALKWSPWVVTQNYRTATLAYIAPNHIAFRRITLHDWQQGGRPSIQVEKFDTTSICLSLAPDAFVEWEDVVWNEGGIQTARGVIATPFVVKPFQVALTGPLNAPADRHAISQCAKSYAAEDETTNPITGLVLHTPDPYNKPPAPLYSLVRLSATATNQDWYQTNFLGQDEPLPQWAEDMGRQMTRLVPRGAALAGYGFDSESDESDDEFMDEDVSSVKLHPCRFRIWAIGSSPGDGCTAVVVSKHSTLHPNRIGTSRVMFGWREQPSSALSKIYKSLTTEGRLWEWMYGQGDQVPGAMDGKGARLTRHLSPLRELFKDAGGSQVCVFCQTPLHFDHEARCSNGHSFATCAATGLAIMRPGISRVCAVCGLRCLNMSELATIARMHLGSEAEVNSTGELCGGCGGKFVV